MKTILAYTSLLCASCLFANSQAARPNILLIVADDLGYGDSSAYGSKIPTPNIDRLARTGVKALDAHAAAAICTPSRYAMMTGEYYFGPWNGELLIEPERGTLATVLQKDGYKTGYFGKWHLGWGHNHKGRKYRADIDWNRPLPAGVLESGFDTYFGTPFSHNESPFVYVRDRRVIGLEADDPITHIGPNEPGGAPHGKSFGGKRAHQARDTNRIDLKVAEELSQWIEQNQNHAFFAKFCLVAPHVPLAVDTAFRGKSQAGVYGDYIMQMDHCIGRILSTLDRLKLTHNTFIVFTSDNGAVLQKSAIELGHHGNGNLLGQKTDAWEGGHRVPFIASWPKHIPQGIETHGLISQIDLCRTLWAAAGIKKWPSTAASQSINQLPLLCQPQMPSPRTTLHTLGVKGYAIRQNEWVYIPRQGSGGLSLPQNSHWTPALRLLGLKHSDYNDDLQMKASAPKTQLYNLNHDLEQSTNIVNDYPERAQQLAKDYQQFIRGLNKRYQAKLKRTQP